MGENEYYQCSSCSSVYDANSDECPNCGGANTFEKKHRETEPERTSSEERGETVAERTPEEIRQETATKLATEGGTPQRPSP